MPLIADCAGRLQDRPKLIKAELLPYDDVDMEGVLGELAQERDVSDGPFIRRYEVGGRKYIEILRFDRYQNPHKNEREAYEKSVKSGTSIPSPTNELHKDGTKTVPSTPRDSTVRARSLDHRIVGSLDHRIVGSLDHGIIGSLDHGDLGENSVSAPTPAVYAVYWDSTIQNVVINEEWLRDEIGEYQHEAGVELTRPEYEHEAEQLRLKLLEDTRLRACIRKANGKPSGSAQFKRLATYTAGWFRRAVRMKAERTNRPARASPPKTFGQLKDQDTASRIQRARERDQRKEIEPSQATKVLPKPSDS
jgi:hypothetical protein